MLFQATSLHRTHFSFQAFKKLTIRNLEIINSVFQVNSASNTFYDCNVESILIEKSYFSMLKPSTFQLRDVETMRIFNNTFGILEGEAFIMDVSDRVIFNNNTISMMHFGAFQGIKTLILICNNNFIHEQTYF